MRQALPLTMVVSLNSFVLSQSMQLKGHDPSVRLARWCVYLPLGHRVRGQWVSNVSEVSKAGKCQ